MCISMSKSKKSQKYEYEIPEGGWGYIVGIGIAFTYYLTLDIKWTYGLIFNDFLRSLDSGTSVSAALQGCFYISYSITCLLYNSIARKVSIRTAGIIGAFLYPASGVFLYFAQNADFLYVALLLQGHGLGLMFPTLYSTINGYFAKRRATVLSLSLLAAGIGPIFVPWIIYYILSNYGFRGCLLILIGIYSNNILVMILAHPADWHCKRILIERRVKEGSVQNENVKSTENADSEVRMQDAFQNKVDGFAESETFIDGHNETNHTKVRKTIHSEGIISRFGRFLDIDLLKQPVFVSIIFGLSFSFYTFSSFLSLNPYYLLELNFSKAETAQISSVCGASDIAARIVYTIMTILWKNESRYYYWCATVTAIFAQFGMAHASEFWSVLLLSATMSFCGGISLVSMSVIIAESLPKERFPAGYGILSCLQGTTAFVNSFIARYIHRRFKSFSAVYIYQNVFLILSASIWFIEFVWMRCKTGNATKPSRAY